MTLICIALFGMLCNGCGSRNKAVLQSRSGYFPEGVQINGVQWDGEYYLLSGDAYRAMFER